MILSKIPQILIALSAIVLSGCSPTSAPSDPKGDSAKQPPAPVFAEDFEAAQALSVGSSLSENMADDDYGRALLCDVALEAVIERLSEGGDAQLPQLPAILDARQIFVERAERLGREQGKTSDQVDEDRTARSQNLPDLRERAIAAIGCMRSLT